MKESEKELVKTIQKLSGKYSHHQVFADWIECFALSIVNAVTILHNQLWNDREKQYVNIMKRYDEKERMEIVKMSYLLTETMKKDMSDVLGRIYMESGSGNKNTAQFFTPFQVSLLCAENVIPKDYDGSRKITLYEPSAGAGGMIIAVAAILQRKELNYQNCIKAVAQDLDWIAVYMCYVQLSLLGIDAVVVQGNTLTEPYTSGNYPRSRIFRTPGNMGLLI